MSLIDEYYEKGFINTQVDDFIKKKLWNEINNIEWIDDEEEGIYKKIPNWYRSDVLKYSEEDIKGKNRYKFERIIGEDILKKTPNSLKQISLELLETKVFNFFKNFYVNSEIEFIDVWNGSEEIPFHFDTINGCDTLVLIYLTEQKKWNKNWGGTITLKKQVNNKSFFEKEFFPTDGNMLIINNSNPLIYHKVTKLKNINVNRYTFSFMYKWF